MSVCACVRGHATVSLTLGLGTRKGEGSAMMGGRAVAGVEKGKAKRAVSDQQGPAELCRKRGVVVGDGRV